MYYKSTGEAVLVQQCNIGPLGSLRWYHRVQMEHLGDCVETIEYYGRAGKCADTEDYYRGTRAAVLVQYSFIGALGSLCWYGRVLQENGRQCW